MSFGSGYRPYVWMMLAVCGTAIPAALGSASAPAIDAAPQVGPGILNLRTGDVRTAERPNLLAGRAAAFGGASRYVLQLNGPMTPERRAALAAAGVRLGDYLPTNAFIADLSATTPAAVAGLGFVTWVGEYAPEWKLDPTIGTREFTTPERQALDAQGQLALVVYLFEGEAVQPALDVIQNIPGVVVFGPDEVANNPAINLTMPRERLNDLAQISSVQFVEEASEITPRNSTVRWIVQSNTTNVTPLYNNGLHGEGQILGHMDGGTIGPSHCSFNDPGVPIGPTHRKILAANFSSWYDTHSGHTAATAVGDAGGNGDTRGVAYLAKLVTNRWPSFTESGMTNALNLHHGQGARVHTNSWGDDGTTAYNGLCRAIDNYSWNNEDGLVVFAVTNQNALRNPENAKNVLAVGASGDAGSQHNHCSGGQGPTNDGRRKPEIYAPGCGTISAASSSGCSVTGMSGTSMASPAVAGTGLLVRQYYMDGYYPSGAANASDGFVPTGALIKATLINSAVDMTGVAGYPSNREGWGRLLADNALYFPGDQRRLIVHSERNNTDGALTTGETFQTQFLVDGSAEQLRVTLAWHDAPGALNASFAAVNNLDLTVTAPNGNVYRGNVFSGGVSVTGGTADDRNNVEQVHVNSPLQGEWTVTVNGTAVNTGSQGFALVITGQVAEASTCAADMNGNGLLDVGDFTAFRNAYLAGDMVADFNGNGALDVADFTAFRNAYLAGCP